MKQLYVHMYELDCYKKFVELYCVIYFLINYLYIIQSNWKSIKYITTHSAYLLYLKIKNLKETDIPRWYSNRLFMIAQKIACSNEPKRFSSIKISI